MVVSSAPSSSVVLSDEVLTKIDVLKRNLADLGSVVVAFSGGTDSALLGFLANEVLGSNALAVTAVSPSLPSDELDHCRDLAGSWSLAWEGHRTDELENPAYVANEGDRCYWCKAELMDVVGPIAELRNATVVLGVNIDDLGEHRPGQKAASERGATFPLVEAGFTKDEIRDVSRSFGLPTWDRPAAACLASRIPYGTPVTLQVLGRVERAERSLRQLGLRELRVRHYDDSARLEVPVADLGAVLAQREAIVAAIKAAGYRYVTLDLEGFRSGNLNDALDPSVRMGAPA